MKKLFIFCLTFIIGVYIYADVRPINATESLEHIIQEFGSYNQAFYCDTFEDVENLLSCKKENWIPLTKEYTDKPYKPAKIVIIFEHEKKQYAYIIIYEKYVAKTYVIET